MHFHLMKWYAIFYKYTVCEIAIEYAVIASDFMQIWMRTEQLER